MNDKREIATLAKAIQQIQLRLGVDFQRTRVQMEAIIEATPDHEEPKPVEPLAGDVEEAIKSLEHYLEDDWEEEFTTIRQALEAKKQSVDVATWINEARGMLNCILNEFSNYKHWATKNSDTVVEDRVSEHIKRMSKQIDKIEALEAKSAKVPDEMSNYIRSLLHNDVGGRQTLCTVAKERLKDWLDQHAEGGESNG